MPPSAENCPHRAAENSSLANDAMRRGVVGDRRAFDTLCRLLRPRLRGFFLRRTRDEAIADDLVRETLRRIYQERTRFEADSTRSNQTRLQVLSPTAIHQGADGRFGLRDPRVPWPSTA